MKWSVFNEPPTPPIATQAKIANPGPHYLDNSKFFEGDEECYESASYSQNIKTKSVKSTVVDLTDNSENYTFLKPVIYYLSKVFLHTGINLKILYDTVRLNLTPDIHKAKPVLWNDVYSVVNTPLELIRELDIYRNTAEMDSTAQAWANHFIKLLNL